MRFGERFIPRLRKINLFANKSGDKLSNVEYLPKLPHDEEHPAPYYYTEEVTLPPYSGPPWKEEADREEKEKFAKMMNDPRIGRHFRDTFLKETVEEEIMATAALVIAEKKNEKKRDETSIMVMEEEILIPTVQREVFVCVWELLYDWGRELPPEELKELQKREAELQMEEQPRKALTTFMFDDKKMSDDLIEERKLSGHKWDVLLYNYHSKLLQNSFEKNVAFHILQEKIVTAIAADEVLNNGVLTYLELDLVHLDEKEKVDFPPRKG